MDPKAPQPEVHCIGCGYSITGIEREALCPECALPVVNSLPETRSLNWDGGSYITLVSMALGFVIHPKTSFTRVSTDPEAGDRFVFGVTRVILLLPMLSLLLFVGMLNRPDGRLSSIWKVEELGIFILLACGFCAVVAWSVHTAAVLILRAFVRRDGELTPHAVAQMVGRFALSAWLLGGIGFATVTTSLALIMPFSGRGFDTTAATFLLGSSIALLVATSGGWLWLLVVGVRVFRRRE